MERITFYSTEQLKQALQQSGRVLEKSSIDDGEGDRIEVIVGVMGVCEFIRPMDRQRIILAQRMEFESSLENCIQRWKPILWTQEQFNTSLVTYGLPADLLAAIAGLIAEGKIVVVTDISVGKQKPKSLNRGEQGYE